MNDNFLKFIKFAFITINIKIKKYQTFTTSQTI